MRFWREITEIEKFNKPMFAKELKDWIDTVEYSNKTFAVIRRAVCSRIAKRQTPHGPGKKK